MIKHSKNNTNLQVDVFEHKREEYLWQENELLARKEELGYGGIGASEFLALKLSSEIGQEKFAQLLELQDQFRALLKAKDALQTESTVVNELNQRHAAMHVDQFYILTEKSHPIFNTKDFVLESRQSFLHTYEAQKITCSDGKMRSKADVWLDSENRRSYDGIVFDPTVVGESNGKYNIWKGFSKEAIEGDASLYWEHVKNIICSGNEDSYRYVRKWLACLFQRPQEVHTALILCGSQATGKNSFVEPLGILFGPHYALLSNIDELMSHFNFHLKNAVLIHANESLWGGNRKEVGKLKSMITEETCLIEGKGQDSVMVRNFKHLIFSSNESWPAHMDADDRRFFVLAVSETQKENHKYFAALKKQLDCGGYEALLYDLLHEDLEGFNPRAIPYNRAAFEVKMLSHDSAARYIYDLLLQGCLAPGGIQVGWWQQGRVPKVHVYQDYVTWCRDCGEKVLTQQLFGITLKRLIPSVKDGRGGYSSARQTEYVFPSLEQCQQEFCKSFKQDMHIFSIDDEFGR